MTALTATIGALTFRLRDERPQSDLPELPARPLMLLDDGTEVRVVDSGAQRYLLIDHRRDRTANPHIEFWECLNAGESEVVGLYAVADLARPVR
ncbi:MAG: hypothetical protein ABI577_09925 [bacterium]